MEINNIVLRRTNANFNMVGQFLGYTLKNNGAQITQGMMHRLINYASNLLKDYDLFFPNLVTVEVAAVSNNLDKQSDYVYSVSFKNAKGGVIGVQGIFTRNGWPFLNHGLFIELE